MGRAKFYKISINYSVRLREAILGRERSSVKV